MTTWTPADLAPVAWYDVDKSTSTTAITDSSGNSRADLTFGSGSNSPALVDAATPMVRHGGAAAAIGLAANALLASATALDIRIALSVPDWTPSGTVALTGQGAGGVPSASTQITYLATDGKLQLTVSNGTAFVTATSSVATGFTDGSLHAIRITWDGSTAKFYTRDPAAADAFVDMQSNTGWTQLGTDIACSQTMNTSPGNQVLALGSISSGSVQVQDGTCFYGAQWGTAIGSSVVAEFNPARFTQTGYTDSVSAKAWTISRGTTNRKSMVVSASANAVRDVILTGADDYCDGPTAAIPAGGSSDSCTLAAVFRPFATQAAGACIFTTRASATAAGVRLEMAGTNTIRAVVSDGTTDVTTSTVSITLGQRAVVGVMLDSAGTCRAFVSNRSGVTLGATSSRPSGSQTGGDLRTSHDQALSAGSDLDAESESPFMSFGSVLPTADLVKIFTYYDGGGRATLDDFTASGTGALRVVGASAVTLDDVTTAGTGALRAVGASAVTLDAATAVATAEARHVGASAVTLDATTASAAAAARHVGASAVTLDATTASGAGALRVTGSVAATLDDVTASGSGTSRVAGSSAVTLDAISTTASGTLRVIGAAALGLDAVTASAAGTLRVVGTLAATLDGVTDAGSGTLSLAGTAALTLDGVTVSGFGSLPIRGQVAVTLDPATVAAVGTARVVGQAAITLDGVTVAGDDLAFRLARIRLTFRERTRAAFREDTRATFREAL